MRLTTNKLLVASAAIALVSGAIGLANTGSAQAPSSSSNLDVVGELAANEGIFVDGKTFKIAKGKAKGDPSAAMARLGAREVGPGAIIFRHNDKIYIAEGSPEVTPQAMKSFQDNWNVSYMKAMKEFQDQWANSYMKSFQDQWAVGYMKNPQETEKYLLAMKSFQDQWNVSYMNAMKGFQDQWNVSYMKNFQDNWDVSYMKAVKEFQDNWATSYMK